MDMSDDREDNNNGSTPDGPWQTGDCEGEKLNKLSKDGK